VKSGRHLRAVRADAIDASISNQPGVSNFLPVGDTRRLRVMPTVGLEYRYPFINVQPWGSMTIEPIAQVIIRPTNPMRARFQRRRPELGIRHQQPVQRRQILGL
jgi:hypothetical protein